MPEVIYLQDQRTGFVKTLTVLLIVHALIFAAQAQSITAVDAVGMTVDNLEKSVDFYTNALGFEKVSEVEVYGSEYERLQGLFGLRYVQARLRLGEESIVLTDYLTVGGRPIPADSRSNDQWFQHIAIVVSDMDSAYAWLRRAHVDHISTCPQTIPKTNPTAAGIRAFYFQDPDGHPLELIYFPPGKGDVRWQSDTDLFLGIDHTAIGIRSTDRSINFYRDVLGMKAGGESYNQGMEQAHLANVPAAHLRISGNRTDRGPGIEFLEYLAPDDGRSYPPDTRPDDLLTWETDLLTDDIEGMYRKLKAHNAELLSPGIVTLPDKLLGYRRGFYVRDPDGHRLGIFEM